VPLRVHVYEWRANSKHTFHLDAADHPPLVLLHLPGRPSRHWYPHHCYDQTSFLEKAARERVSGIFSSCVTVSNDGDTHAIGTPPARVRNTSENGNSRSALLTRSKKRITRHRAHAPTFFWSSFGCWFGTHHPTWRFVFLLECPEKNRSVNDDSGSHILSVLMRNCA
jgi:hypothetical protein